MRSRILHLWENLKFVENAQENALEKWGGGLYGDKLK